MTRTVVATTALLFLGSAGVEPRQATGQLRAGAAMVDITPDAGQLAVSTDLIRDPLFVRAIVVDDGSTCAVLVGADLGNVSTQVTSDALPRAAAATGCPAQNFLVSATHTHSSNTGGLGQGAPTAQTIANAIVNAASAARAKLAPARVAYGTTQVDLNVNRDLFNRALEWRQEPNPDGPSDKTLSVAALVGADDVPIGVYMNYGMHPINFYLSGAISADFPGEASRYVEELFDGRTVAIFTQGASGDQNPRDFRAPHLIMANTTALSTPRAVAAPPDTTTPAGFNPQQAASTRGPIPRENLDAYRKVLARTGRYVEMLGTAIGSASVRAFRESTSLDRTARIYSDQTAVTCGGRIRLDADNPARENVFPGYRDGPDVTLRVGLLRIGDINFVGINGEVYSEIATRLKAESPATRTMVVTLANGSAGSGYIYSDAAYSHLTFQVIGSRLKPGCAENGIVSAATGMMRK